MKIIKKILAFILVFYLSSNFALSRTIKIEEQNNKKIIRDPGFEVVSPMPSDHLFDEIKSIENSKMNEYGDYFIVKKGVKYGIIKVDSVGLKAYPDYTFIVPLEYNKIETIKDFQENFLKLYKNNKAYVWIKKTNKIKEIPLNAEVDAGITRYNCIYILKENDKYSIYNEDFKQLASGAHKVDFYSGIYKIGNKYGTYSTPPVFDSIERYYVSNSVYYYIIQYKNKFYIVEEDKAQSKSFKAADLKNFQSFDRIDSCGYKPYLMVYVEDKWYFVDKKEKYTGNEPYIEAQDLKYMFDNNFIKKLNNKYAIVKLDKITDENNKTIIKEKKLTDYIYDNINYPFVEINNKKGFVHIKDDKVTSTPVEYDKINNLVANNFIKDYHSKLKFIDVEKDNKKYILKHNIKSNKTTVFSNIPQEAEKCYLIKNGVVFLKDNKYGFSNKKGKIILKPEYDLIYNPSYRETRNYLFVKQGDKYALYNIKDKKMSEFKYDNIYLYWDSTIKAEYKDNVKIYNELKGKSRGLFNKSIKPVEIVTDSTINIGLLVVFPPSILLHCFNFGWMNWVDFSINMPEAEYPKPYFELKK